MRNFSILIILILTAFLFSLSSGDDALSREVKKPAPSVNSSSSNDIVIINLGKKKPQPSSADGTPLNLNDSGYSGASEEVVVFDLTKKNGMLERSSLTHHGTRILFFEAEPFPVPGASPLSSSPCDGGEFFSMISEIAEKYNLDPQLVKIVIEVESGFNPNACSPQNAMGLMQIIPETARSLNLENPYDPYENIKAGVRYLRLQLDRFGCIELALAAYNAGPGAVEKYGGIPPYEETQNYVRTIMERYYNGESD